MFLSMGGFNMLMLARGILIYDLTWRRAEDGSGLDRLGSRTTDHVAVRRGFG